MEAIELMNLVKDKNELGQAFLSDKVLFIKRIKGVFTLAIMDEKEYWNIDSQEIYISPDVFNTYLKYYINDVISCDEFAIATLEANRMKVALGRGVI